MITFVGISIATLIFGLMAAAWYVGRSVGLRLRGSSTNHPQLALVQSGILGLLGLLLAFSFAGAMTRFVERQEILVAESNAIGTLYLRADLLDDQHRDRLRDSLLAYATLRMRLFDSGTGHDESPIRKLMCALSLEVWNAVADGVKDRPHAALLLVPACNDVIDLLAVRNAAVSRHIPTLVLAVLLACSLASMATFGIGVETSGPKLHIPVATLMFLITALLWTTIDLDFPRVGLIRINPDTLTDVTAMMEELHAQPQAK